jgi:hypothetical protein
MVDMIVMIWWAACNSLLSRFLQYACLADAAHHEFVVRPRRARRKIRT